jgi:hypothetical protein
MDDESKSSKEAGMWNLLKKNDERCKRMMDLLEESAAARTSAASVEELCVDLSAAERTHITSCPHCREAAQDLLAAKEIFRNVGSDAAMARPWFATRVMAAIASRERELSETASAWLAIPKFASRLALASSALLLVASTWLYERPSSAPVRQPAAVSSQEYLFEPPPPPMNQDDVLISLAEQNQ